MAQFIDITDLYTSVASSVGEANRLLEKAAENAEVSYVVTELDFSVPFSELMIEGGRVQIALTKETEQVSEIRNLKFKVRFVPRTTIEKVEEEQPPSGEFTVPDVRGATLDEATVKLKDSGFALGTVKYDPKQVPAGRVLSQSPAPLAKAKAGAAIALVIGGRKPV